MNLEEEGPAGVENSERSSMRSAACTPEAFMIKYDRSGFKDNICRIKKKR